MGAWPWGRWGLPAPPLEPHAVSGPRSPFPLSTGVATLLPGDWLCEWWTMTAQSHRGQRAAAGHAGKPCPHGAAALTGPVPEALLLAEAWHGPQCSHL